MKWLAIAGLAALVVLILITMDPTGRPDRPDTPAPSPTTEPDALPDTDIASAEVVVPTGPASIEVLIQRDQSSAAARVEIRQLDRDNRLDLPFSEAEPIAAFDVGPEGEYQFTDLPIGSYEVTARSADGVRARTRAFCRPRSPHARVVLTLRGGDAGLAGRAVYADGRPFHGVVHGYSVRDFLCQERTSEDGRFSLTALLPGKITLTFLEPGAVAYHIGNVEVPQSTEQVFVVDEGLTGFLGRVIADDDEEAVAGASVRASGSTPVEGPRMPFGRAPDRAITQMTTTDVEGGFRFRLPVSTARFWIEAKGFETAQVTVEVDGVAIVRMKRQGTLAGRVVRDSDGSPVAGAVVRAWNWHTFTTRADFAVTDEHGRFEGPAGPGQGMVYVLGGGWVSADLPDVTEHAANPLYAAVRQGERVEIEIRVIPSADARGVVVDQGGEPVPGAEVFVDRKGETRAILGSGILEVTDAEGKFAIEDLVPGYPYRFRAGNRGEPIALTDPMTAEPGGTIELTIVLPEARWLTVRLLEKRTGEPIEGARVSARQASGHQPPGGTTGPDGRVRIGPSAPGDVTLYIHHEDYASPGAGPPVAHGTTVADPGPDPEEHVLELTRVYTLSGRIVTVPGESFAGGMLAVVTRSDEGEERHVAGLFSTGEGGSFRMTGVPPGSYQIVLRAGMRRETKLLGRWPVEVPSEDLELVLHPAAADDAPPPLAFAVFGPDNRPASARVEVWAGSAQWPQVRFARDGKAVSEPVPVGTRIWIQIRDAKCADGRPAGGSFHGPVESTGEEIVIHLPEARSISGKVVGPDGSPVAGVMIRPQAVPPEELAKREFGKFHLRGILTDKAGAFEITGLGNRTCRLFLEVPPTFALAAPELVEPGTEGLEIRLVGGVECSPRVVDAEGDPVAGATVTVARPGAARKGMTGSDGRVRIRGLAADHAHSLVVDAPAGRSDLAGIRMEAWTPADGDVVLPRGEVVQGTVRGRSSPLPRAWVWWKDSRGGWQRVSADVTGDFRIVVLAGSRVTLRAAPVTSPDRERAGPEVNVEAGAKNVSLPVSAPR